MPARATGIADDAHFGGQGPQGFFNVVERDDGAAVAGMSSQNSFSCVASGW